MKKFYDKINELKELKNIKIKNNQIHSYNKEISLLKEKQKYLYDDFINKHKNAKDELDFKFSNKIAQVKNNNKKEIKNLNKGDVFLNKNFKNKKILILEKNLSLCEKLNLDEKAEESKEEIKKEKIKLNNIMIKQKQDKKKLILKNLNRNKNKKMDKIIMNYTKEKNELEIKFIKEKNILLNKFKNQLTQFKNLNNKNQKYEKIKYLYNNNTNKLNKSFDKELLNKKIEEDESDISFNI